MSKGAYWKHRIEGEQAMSDKPSETFWISRSGYRQKEPPSMDQRLVPDADWKCFVDAEAFERLAKELERSEVQLQLNRNGIGEHVIAYAEAVSLIRELRDIFRLLLPTLPASTQIDRCSDGISKADLFLKGGK